MSKRKTEKNAPRIKHGALDEYEGGLSMQEWANKLCALLGTTGVLVFNERPWSKEHTKYTEAFEHFARQFGTTPGAMKEAWLANWSARKFCAEPMPEGLGMASPRSVPERLITRDGDVPPLYSQPKLLCTAHDVEQLLTRLAKEVRKDGPSKSKGAGDCWVNCGDFIDYAIDELEKLKNGEPA